MSLIRKIGARFAGATDVIVIGAGQSGLGTSHLLAEHGVNHVVLERGRVANAWRGRRDSLTLLTPNRQTRLPGFSYSGSDPDGFMGMPELIGFMEDYARHSNTPVHTNTTVTSVRKDGDDYRVTTSRGEWLAKAVVIASGACNTPSVPAIAREIPEHIRQLTPANYCSAAQVPAGSVLVVGASATGLQYADELAKAGRDVTIAVGEHVRVPRRYRGRDIMDWMDRCGILDERYNEIDDVSRGRRLPSTQLVGSHERPILDLNCLSDQGARIAGRLVGVNNGTLQFSGSLRNVCALADLKMKRLLNSIDEFIANDASVPPAELFDDTRLDDSPLLTLDLDKTSIRTIVWATGYRPDYRWLDVPVLDRKGHIRHDGGIVESPGLYVMGLPLMRRRKSSFIYGVEDDARDITNHLVHYLDTVHRSNSHAVYQDHSREPGYRRSA